MHLTFHMSPARKLYIKAFLFMGLVFGLLSILLDSILFDQQYSILHYLISGIFFGLVMSISMVPSHVSALKKYSDEGLSDEVLSVSQVRKLESDMDPDQLIDRLRNKSVFKNMKLSVKEKLIEIRTGFSFESFGEVIRIEVGESDPGIFQYTIKSRPKLGTMFLDNGRNYRNVQLVSELLT